MKLIITEKRDQAEKMSAAMGWKSGRGCFTGTFEGDSVDVVWARGHLLALKSPDEIQAGLPWDDPSALVPIPSAFEMRVGRDIPGMRANSQPRTYFDNIKKKVATADEVIIATDSDREGEAIGWEILEFCHYRGKVRRAWLAAGLDKKSILDAMKSLRSPDITKSWFRASEARSWSDYTYMFSVRAMTHYSRYGVLGSSLVGGKGREGVLSFGRVQGPTLAMIVDREREIRSFKPQNHHKVSAMFESGPARILSNYQPNVRKEHITTGVEGVVWDERAIKKEGDLPEPLFVSKPKVEAFCDRVHGAADAAYIKSVKEGTRKEEPPKTFSLTTAQMEIGKQLRISGPLTQVILEDLYEQGWTSYARTSKTDLPDNLYQPNEIHGSLAAVHGIPELQKQADEARLIHDGAHPKWPKFKPSVFVKKDMEHHGIIPTHQKMTEAALDSLTPRKGTKGKVRHSAAQMKQAWLIIAKRYIQMLYPPVTYNYQSFKLAVPVEDLLDDREAIFSGKLECIAERGWRNAFSAGSAVAEDNLIIGVAKDTKAKVLEVMVKAAKTQPPRRFTLITMPTEMENAAKYIKDPVLRKKLDKAEGIGRPSTRSTVIDTLIVRKYIITDKKGTITPTDRGEGLYDVLPAELKTPDMSALWEQELEAICNDRDDRAAMSMRDAFVERQKQFNEGLITGLIEKYSKATEGKSRIFIRDVSPKMKAAIIKIAKAKGIKGTAAIINDPVKAQEFLNVHLSAATEKQVALARRLMGALEPGSELMPAEEDLKDRKKCTEFIEKAKEALGGKELVFPPSEKQVALARKLADSASEPITDEILASSAKCSEYISMAMKSVPPSEKQLALAKKLADKLDDKDKPSDEVFKSRKLCSEFIDKQFNGGGKSKSSGKPKGKFKGKPRRRKAS